MPPNNSKDFSLKQMQDLIRQKGEFVNYSTGHKCPCSIAQTGTMLPDPNRANPSCQACNGLGWVWIPQSQVIGLVQGIQSQKDLLEAGIASPGDMMLSPQIGTQLSDYDKIQLTWPDGIPFEGEVLVRSTSGETDTSYYSIMSVPPDGCFSVNPDTGALTTYLAGTDFSYSGTTITWGLSANQPLPGSAYSFKYSAQMDWICLVPPQSRRERGTNLGQRVILRKKHVVFNGV